MRKIPLDAIQLKEIAELNRRYWTVLANNEINEQEHCFKPIPAELKKLVSGILGNPPEVMISSVLCCFKSNLNLEALKFSLSGCHYRKNSESEAMFISQYLLLIRHTTERYGIELTSFLFNCPNEICCAIEQLDLGQILQAAKCLQIEFTPRTKSKTIIDLIKSHASSSNYFHINAMKYMHSLTKIQQVI